MKVIKTIGYVGEDDFLLALLLSQPVSTKVTNGNLTSVHQSDQWKLAFSSVGIF